MFTNQTAVRSTSKLEDADACLFMQQECKRVFLQIWIYGKTTPAHLLSFICFPV